MHLLKDLLGDIIKRGEENNAKKICKVYIKMGKYTEINPEILLHFFKEKTKGTIVEGAEVEIENSDARELRLVSFDCE